MSLAATPAAECVDLVVGVLLGGRDARVSEEHGVENTGPAGGYSS
jgi:hypothetical protein